MYKDTCGNEFCFDSGGSTGSGQLLINGAAAGGGGGGGGIATYDRSGDCMSGPPVGVTSQRANSTSVRVTLIGGGGGGGRWIDNAWAPGGGGGGGGAVVYWTYALSFAAVHTRTLLAPVAWVPGVTSRARECTRRAARTGARTTSNNATGSWGDCGGGGAGGAVVRTPGALNAVAGWRRQG